jgi:hypothetical protein
MRNRFTDEQLQAMAKSALWHKAHSPMVYTQFIHILGMATRFSLPEVESKILELSRLSGEQQPTN